MPLEIKSAVELDDHQMSAVTRFVTRNTFVDHQHQFRFGDEPEIRTAVRAHLTATPLADGCNSPYPWAGSGFPIDPFISLEDAKGGLFGLQHCKEAVGFAHTYGALVRDQEAGETWLFVGSGSQSQGTSITAADIRDGAYAPIRILGQSDSAVDDMGPLEQSVISEGEFYFSAEAQPVLIGCPWWGEISASEGINEEVREANRALIEALRERVDVARTMSAAAGPELTGP